MGLTEFGMWRRSLLKKRILCYGDSNTHGYIPCAGGRYPEDVRWPTVLQRLLGEEYTVIEEGFNGRTTVYDDPVEGGFKSGASYLPPCLMTHNPLDLVILMLGTNDAKQRFGGSAKVIAMSNQQLIELIHRYGANPRGRSPKILLIAPIRIGENVIHTDMSTFGPFAASISAGFAEEYAAVAKAFGCDFLDAASVAEPSALDCIHLTEEGHLALAEAVAGKIRQILG